MRKRKNKYIPPKTESSAKNDQFSFKKLIAILLVVNLLTTGVSFAYCMESGSLYDAARVAKFAVSVNLPDDAEAVIVKGAATQKTIFEVPIQNYSDVAVTCNAVLTYATTDVGTAGKIKVSCQIDDGPATTPKALATTNTFNNLGAIPPNSNGSLKLIFETNKHYAEDYFNEFVYGLKLAITINQVD